MQGTVIMIAALAVLNCCIGHAQEINDDDVARLLAGSSTQKEEVNKIVAAGDRSVPLLLSLAESPPPMIDRNQLYVGLADVFGSLKIKQAIPFLVKNIGVDRTGGINTWRLNTPETMEGRLAAVAALEQLGHDAVGPLLEAYRGPLTVENRVLVIFTVSRIKDKDPRIGDFLRSVLGDAGWERNVAEAGVKTIEGRN